jgi:TonB-dependent SusC/RagA subfamily outer membrane receptor
MKTKVVLLLMISLFFVSASHAQKKKRTKKVVLKIQVMNTENKAVKNASIFIDQKNTRRMTDTSGMVKLKVKPSAKTITVFTLAAGAVEKPYQGESLMKFVLKATNEIQEDPLNKKVEKENDIVYNGFIKAHKRNLNTNIHKVNSNIIENAEHYRTIYEMIAGEVPGVTVNGSTIRIRGVSSLSQSNDPLFVVNGMIVGSLDYILPTQVKSISILKGTATALYGVRGANGAIVITLKTVNE